MSAARPWVLAGAALTTINGIAAWTWPTLSTLTATVGVSVIFAVVHSLSTGGRAPGRLTRGPVTTNDAATGTPASTGTERCCVCGGPDTPYENYRGQLFCWPCANCGCVQDVCVRTGINDPALSGPAAIRTATEFLRGTPAVACAGCPGCGGPDCIGRGDEDAELTADEARELADDLGRELYAAQDALAFVGECCDIADRDGHQPTTADVRRWLRGAECARLAGLVFTPDQLGLALPDRDSKGLTSD